MIRAVLAATFFAFRLIPRRLAVVGGRAVGWLMEHVFHFRTDVVDLQLQRVYGDTGKRSQTEIAAIRHGVYRHFGLLLFETLRLPGADLEPYRQLVTVEGREHLDAALARGKGVMLINAHVGNWELGAISVVQAGYDLCAVSKEMRSPVVQTAMDMLRQTTGLDTFYRRNSARKILRALRQNRAVIMVIDQNMIDTEGEFVEFFGYPACTMTAVASLAERTGAAVVPVCCYRQPDLMSHQTVIWPALELEFPHDDREANILHNTQRHTEAIEQMIERHPDQWNWIHKRWRTRPPDEQVNPFDYKRGLE